MTKTAISATVYPGGWEAVSGRSILTASNTLSAKSTIEVRFKLYKEENQSKCTTEVHCRILVITRLTTDLSPQFMRSPPTTDHAG